MTAVLDAPVTTLSHGTKTIDSPARESLVAQFSVHIVSPEPEVSGSPMDKLIEQWVALAARHARVRKVDEIFVADVVGLNGVWSDGDTPEEAVAELPTALTDWVSLKLADGDKDVPAMEGVKLILDG